LSGPRVTLALLVLPDHLEVKVKKDLLVLLVCADHLVKLDLTDV